MSTSMVGAFGVMFFVSSHGVRRNRTKKRATGAGSTWRIAVWGSRNFDHQRTCPGIEDEPGVASMTREMPTGIEPESEALTGGRLLGGRFCVAVLPQRGLGTSLAD
jgi:hypothetical protein